MLCDFCYWYSSSLECCTFNFDSDPDLFETPPCCREDLDYIDSLFEGGASDDI